MFGGDVIVFNRNLTAVVHLLYMMDNNLQKSCSAAAISVSFILTAAHCLIEKPEDGIQLERLHIKVHGLYGNTTTYQALSARIHPEYVPEKGNDVGFVVSKQQLPLTPIEVNWDPGKNILENCIGAGFGNRYPIPFSSTGLILSRMTYPQEHILSESTCEKFKAVTHGTNKTICIFVTSSDEQAPCHGDSGGPLICQGVLRGLLSRGMIIGYGDCGSSVGIMVFEKVYEHREFIMNRKYDGRNEHVHQNLQSAQDFLHPTEVVIVLSFIPFVYVRYKSYSCYKYFFISNGPVSTGILQGSILTLDCNVFIHVYFVIRVFKEFKNNESREHCYLAQP